MTNDMLAKLAAAFRAGIVANLKEKAKANGGKLALGTEAVKAAAFPAFAEAMESEFDAQGQPMIPTPLEMAVIWEGVLKINESAFRQGLEREAKAGTLGFEIVGSAHRARGLALQYLTPQG